MPAEPAAALRVSNRAAALEIDTGCSSFVVRPGDGFPFGHSLEVVDDHGRLRRAVVRRFQIEEAGPLYARVRVDCELVGAEASEPLELFARVAFVAGSPCVRFDVTLRNPRRATHSGGFWELGDPGSVLLSRASLRLALPDGTGRLACSPGIDVPSEELPLPFELYQESSGGENWQSRVHVNRDGVVPLRFRGYRLRAGTIERSGLRAEPLITIGRDFGVALPRFWSNFPKAVECDGETLTLHFFPPQTSDRHELQGGEQKTHSFYVAFGDDRITESPLAWCRSPVRVSASPEWNCRSGAVPFLVPKAEAGADDELRSHEQLIEAALDASDGFVAKRERIDEYGWRHFGDIYADHEAAFHEGPEPLVSHYNNQYDAIAGFALQFLRSGDFRWWQLMNELAAHVADIDVYHTDEDRPAYNHGFFWHTFHYVDAERSAHRCYPRAKGVNGGGPANEHNYTTGLLLHYFLTGEPLSYDTVLDLAGWVVDMDDGAKTMLRWLARGPTGAASATTNRQYHGPGRGAGNSINALLDAFLLTRERRFLAKTEELVRRCIHPSDDLAARDLPNVELRWSYVVFLQKLARYLEVKIELGEDDAMYAYARGALLHYARWMAANERPYLDRPEILEYPTETWAAHDIRKSDVLYLAALHCDGDERARFVERARYFFRSSSLQLRSMETRTRARPVVILLSNGLLDAWFRRNPGASAPAPRETPSALPEPQFTPQRTRALRRLLLISGAALLAVLTAAAFWLASPAL